MELHFGIDPIQDDDQFLLFLVDLFDLTHFLQSGDKDRIPFPKTARRLKPPLVQAGISP